MSIRMLKIYITMALSGLVVILASAACGPGWADTGNGGAASAVPKITATDHIFTVDELTAADFKIGKTYDVEGLQGATAAVYGFWGLDPYNRAEYELRFYESHADAIELGTPMADEGSGDNAKLTTREASWTEGLTERRECQGQGGHQAGACTTPRYMDYVILGNMVMMCQGRDSFASLENCGKLMAQIHQQ